MSYIINKYNGEQLIVLEDGTIDTTTSLSLVGRNYVGYGEIQNENFVFLLENFSNNLPPSSPMIGQAWYDSSKNVLKTYDGIKWNPVGSALIEDTAPIDPTEGALWLKTGTKQLFVFYLGEWRLVGPEGVAGFGETRTISTTLLDVAGQEHPVILFTVDNIVIAITSSYAFTINESNAIPGFLDLIIGTTYSTIAVVKGNLDGNAFSATRLQSTRKINGIGFNGTSDINIKSSTTYPLIKGSYITGETFDGSSETTWSVDASSSNTIGKVVARDSQGNFEANIISADLNGNVNSTVGTSKFNVVEAKLFVGETLTGNALTATKLQTPRKINGVDFDGSADITVSAAAGTLTGTSINPTVEFSSLKQVGILNNLRVSSNGIIVGNDEQFKMFVDGNKPVIRSSVDSQGIALQISNSSYIATTPTVEFLTSGQALSEGGAEIPAITRTSAGEVNLGLPSKPWNNLFVNGLVGESVNVSKIKSASGTVIAEASVVITGNLTVEGTVTTINSNDVSIEDRSLTLANGASTPAQADGAGIIIDGTFADGELLGVNASMLYSSTNSRWVFNRDVFAGSNDFVTNGYFRGVATSAQYADLAECYVADKAYEPGTVLELGGENEVTEASNETSRIIGVVSTNPAYLMNSECKGEFVVSVALQGRIPCKVIGPIKKGDMLVSAGNGKAKSSQSPSIGTVIGKSMQDFNEKEGVIEVIVGRI